MTRHPAAPAFVTALAAAVACPAASAQTAGLAAVGPTEARAFAAGAVDIDGPDLAFLPAGLSLRTEAQVGPNATGDVLGVGGFQRFQLAGDDALEITPTLVGDYALRVTRATAADQVARSRVEVFVFESEGVSIANGPPAVPMLASFGFAEAGVVTGDGVAEVLGVASGGPFVARPGVEYAALLFATVSLETDASPLGTQITLEALPSLGTEGFLLGFETRVVPEPAAAAFLLLGGLGLLRRRGR